MSARYQQRPARREPLPLKTVLARLFFLLILVSMFFTLFVFPWMFGGR